jgi:hypothetical protein
MAYKPPLDLDLGWHLKYGEYFFRTGTVLKDNIMSFVWPDYKWVQASWGYDLLVYQLFTHLGFFGLSFFGALITFFVFVLLSHPWRRFSLSFLFLLMVLFLAMTTPLYYSAIRSQTPSGFLFALCITIAFDTLINIKSYSLFSKKTYLFLPLLFLFWANMHGGFFLGIVVCFIAWVTTGFLLFLKNKRGVRLELIPVDLFIKFGGILALSILLTLINPWGLGIYRESVLHASNINLNAISEWFPLSQFGIIPFGATLFTFLLTLSIFLFRKKWELLPLLFSYFITTYLAFSAMRFLILFGIMTTFIWARFWPEIHQNGFIKRMRGKWFKRISIIGIIVTIATDIYFYKLYFSIQAPLPGRYTWNTYCTFAHDCSTEIGNIMRDNPPIGNGFHPYNIAGYLIWNVPMVKTFIDQRMPAWEENGKTPPFVDSEMEKNPIYFRKMDSIYHFTWAIVYSNTRLSNYLDSMAQGGIWSVQYRDEFYTYYIKKGS